MPKAPSCISSSQLLMGEMFDPEEVDVKRKSVRICFQHNGRPYVLRAVIQAIEPLVSEQCMKCDFLVPIQGIGLSDITNFISLQTIGGGELTIYP